jgi:hypothetical protein
MAASLSDFVVYVSSYPAATANATKIPMSEPEWQWGIARYTRLANDQKSVFTQLMKKLILWFLILVVVLIALAAVAVHLYLDTAAKRTVESVGSDLMKVQVKLDLVNLSLLSGSGKIKGLVVANPEGYKTLTAISVGTTSVALQPASLLSEKIVIRSIAVEAPEVTFETDLTKNNLSQLLANLKESTGGGKESTSTNQPTSPKEAKPGKKLEIDSFVFTGGKVKVNVNTVAGGGATTVTLPEIRLKDLGKNSDGITPAELTSLVLNELVAAATKVASAEVQDLAKKGAVILSNEAGKMATNAVDKVTHGLGDLLKGKK